MDDKKVIENLYKEYAKKHGLPDFGDLDKEIEFVDTFLERHELPGLFLTSIRRRFVDVTSGWINYLHNFLLPNQQSMILVHEAGNITEEEKDIITMAINKLMLMSRVSAKLELQKEDSSDAAFLVEYFTMWIEMKKELIPITEKNVSIWEEAIEKKEKEEAESHYVG